MEVKLVECPNGHFFDVNVHKVCPYCGQKASHAALNVTQPAGNGATPGAGVTQHDSGNFVETRIPGGPHIGGQASRTMPADNNNENDSFGKTRPSRPDYEEDQIEPVVGWLVCIEGPMKGQDFRLHDGYNYIGRESGDIVIQGDSTISRQKHAIVSFYSKRGNFYVGPGDGRNIIELNDEPVMSPVVLESYDVITLGNTKLLLIAMCGKRFSWTEGVKE